MRGTSSYAPRTSLYAPQQPPPSPGHPPISTGYSSKLYSGNNQSRRGRGKISSNLISPRATSSDFLLVTLRFLPDCSLILYIHAPVRIYGVTYYSTTTISDVIVLYNTSGPWNLMLFGHANY